MGVVEKIADKINHRMVGENRLCSRFRTSKSDCSICADLCPIDAISISEKGVEIREWCIDCGVCISACQNGVFRVNGRDDGKIISEIQKTIQEVKTFRISCVYGDETSDLILPCLSRLTEALLLEPVKMGVPDIEILRPSCEKCRNKRSAPHLDRVIKQTYYIYEMLGLKSDSISIINTEFRKQRNLEITTQNAESETISRREFFGSLKNRAMGIAEASIPDVMNKDNGNGEVFRKAIQNKPENIKRSRLLEVIKEIGSGIKGQGSTPHSALPPDKIEVPSSDCIIAELEVRSKCTACGVCATLCPTGAITQQWTEDHYNLSYKPALCTNCNVCVHACMHKAIRTKENVLLNLLLEDTEVRLFEATKKSCIVCRMDFVGGELEICPLCMHIHYKQMAAIRGLFNKEG